MSNDSVSVQSLLDKFNIKSTRFIFLIFTTISLVLVFIFYLIIENGRKENNEQIFQLAETRNLLSDTNNQLADELMNSFNRSLLFHQTSKESDRFQTIYSLRSTKNIFDQYFEKCTEIDQNNEIGEDFTNLRNSLSNFSLLIAESINSDGKLNEMMEQVQNPEDSVNQFLFESENLGMDVSDARSIEASLEEIQTQLFSIENQIQIIIDQEFAGINSNSQSYKYIILGILLFILIFVFSILLLTRTKITVDSLSKVLNNIAKGELPDIKIRSEREFKPILQSSNEIISYMDNASQFAQHIGDGDFNFEFEPKSKEDALGNSLIEMRNRLQQVTREDKIRNWMNEGQAKFGEILRQYNDDLQELGTNLISNLVNYLNANQGALFILKEEDERQYLELLSAYAFNRKKFIEKKLEIGEGLAGQAFTEGKTIYLKEIKSDHYNIVTGLGESKPTSLLIVPLKEEDKIEGIVEIASLEEIKPHEIEFIESIGESIASSLNSGKINETTKKLLNETQEKAEEMKAQEEELRQNMEELAATQEQMERRNKELEEIQIKFDKERYLLNALLNSGNDRIYFKDLESKFIRVSQSMIDLFDKKDESEVLGKSDFDFGFEEHAKVAFEDEQRIIRTGRPMEDVVEKEQWDDGRVTWVSTTKNPLRDLEGKTVGTFGISRDVTKSKQMELDLHKRKEWLENFFKYHSVGFVVIDQNGNVAFATSEILAQLGRGDINEMIFEDVFAGLTFDDFLLKIKFRSIKDEQVELELNLNDEDKTPAKYMIISSSKKNEDGTQNIFLIQN